MFDNYKYLSPSRIDTYNICSYSYWANYHLHLPQKQNKGATIGTIVHEILEYLIKPNKRKKIERLIQSRDISEWPALTKLIKLKLAKEQINDDIQPLILTALKNDFLGPKNAKIYGEKEFEEIIEYGEFKFGVRGIIDKVFLYDNDTKLLVQDYKTDSRLWAQDKKELNLQHILYVMVLKKMFPHIEVENIDFKFIFLRFPNEAILHPKPLSDEELYGAAMYFNEISNRINNFTENDSTLHFAKNDGFLPKEKGFGGLLKCGNKVYSPTQLKKDGTPAYYCPYKFAFDYYGLYDENNKLIKTAFNSDDLQKKDNQKIKLLKFGGCPAWK